MEMDPMLWRNLPEHVLEVILIHLPVAALTRFRCVCKRFNALLSCRSFLVKHPRSLSVSRPWLVHTQGTDSKAWSFERNKWMELRIRVPWFANVLASASGFVAMAPASKGVGRPARIRVVNAFAGLERRLPPIGHPAAAQLVVNPGGYHVYALCEGIERGRWLLQHFSSCSNAWEVLSPELPLAFASINVCNGVVFCTAGYRTLQFAVWSFDVELRRWQQEALPCLPPDARCQFVSCGKRAMLMTHCDGVLRVWQLDRKKWTTALSLPDEISDRGGVSCCAQGDLLFIISSKVAEISVAGFDLVSQRIQYAPPVVGALTTSKSFPFYPSLSTLV